MAATIPAMQAFIGKDYHCLGLKTWAVKIHKQLPQLTRNKRGQSYAQPMGSLSR